MSSHYTPLEFEESKKEPMLSGQDKNEEFDDDTIPPDFSLCEKHLQATSVGIEDTTNNELCKCCALRVAKTPLNLMDPKEKLAYMGPGYTLYFLFMKYAIAFLLFFFAFVGIYELAVNSAGTYCSDDPNCYKGMALLLSLYNKINDPKAMGDQQWLNLVLILVLIVMLQLLRRQKRATAALCDENDISASDYTLMVENIPKDKGLNYKEELKNLFEELEPYEDGDKKFCFKVTKINLTYDLDELAKLEQIELKAVEQKTKAYIYKRKHGRFPPGVTEESLMEEINKREADIYSLSQEMCEGRKGDFSGVAFVSFQSENMKQELLSRYQVSPIQRFRNAFKFLASKDFKNGLFMRGQRIYISQAAEPGDVHWKNMHLQDKQRYLRKLCGYLFSLGLLILCAVLIYYLLVEQDELKNKAKVGDPESETKIKALTAILAFSIVAINKILSLIIPCIAYFEKNKTITEDHSSTVFKLSLAQFINSGFLTFFVTYFIVENYSGDGGLFVAANSVFISNALLNPILYTINVGYLFAKFKRWYYTRQGRNCILTQGQANKTFENPDFPIQTTSAAMINTLWFTMFYCSVLPIGILFSLLCFIYEYFVLKHMLIRRSSIVHEMGDELAEEMTDLMEVSLVWFALGNFIFNAHFNTTEPYSFASIMVLIIGVIHYLLPTNTINEFFFDIYSKNEELNYEVATLQFDKDYDRENPCTKEAARKARLSSVKENL